MFNVSYKTHSLNGNCSNKTKMKAITFGQKKLPEVEMVNLLGNLADAMKHTNADQRAFFEEFNKKILPLLKKNPELSLGDFAKKLEQAIDKRCYF